MEEAAWKTFFADAEPIPQDDGPVPVVQIDYAPEFVEVMGYFRRVLVDGEHSERSLLLSAAVIQSNAANYTAWQYRRTCLGRMHGATTPPAQQLKIWEEEKDYCTEQCLKNMKNYQVWFHRRACITKIKAAREALQTDATPTGQGELDFVKMVLGEDSKTYHAWGHRQWVLEHFGTLWAGELPYVDALLEEDLRNNSAWNQRHFVLQRTGQLADARVIAREAEYALAMIRRAPSNPSPWAYLEGIVSPKGFSAVPQVRAACEELGQVGTGAATASSTPADGAAPPPPPPPRVAPRCVAALALLARICESSGDAADAARASSLCEELIKLDPIRERFWRWRAAQPRSS